MLKYTLQTGLFAVASFFICAPSLQAQQIQQLPVETFSDNPDVDQMTLSPDGSAIAYRTFIEGKDAIFIQNVDGSGMTPLAAKKKFNIESFRWANDETLLIVYRQIAKGRSKFGGSRLYSFNRKTNTFEGVIKPKTGTSDPVRNQGSILSILPNDKNKILMSLTLSRSDGRGIFEVDITNGKRQSRNHGGNDMGNWIFDTNSTVRNTSGLVNINFMRIVNGLSEEEHNQLETHKYSLDGENWEITSSSQKSFIQNAYDIGYLNDNKTLVATGTYQSDQTAAYIFNPANSDGAIPHSTMTAKDIGEILYDEYTEKLIGFKSLDISQPDHYVDPVYILAQKIANSQIRGATIKIRNKVKNQPIFLLEASNDRHFGTYFLLNSITKKITPIANIRDKAKPGLMAPSKEVLIPTRDGLTLHAILTSPVSQENAPLVILTSRATSRIHLSAQSLKQFLANRGFNVLQVATRGAIYSQSNYEAGIGEIGDKIAEDVVDATIWAQKSLSITNNKTCLLGQFGEKGMIAMLAYLKSPNIYQCLISNDGFVRIPYNDRNGFTLSQTLKGYTDGRNFLNFNEKSKQSSPLENTEQFKIPMLIIAEDNRNFYKSHYYLKKFHEKVKTSKMISLKRDDLPTQRNSFHRKKIYTEIEKFLAKHIGE